MRGFTYSRTRLIILLATLALFFAVSSNIALTIQAHRNCESIELIKGNAQAVLVDNYNDMVTGKNDAAFRHFYGALWVQEKEAAIIKLQKQIARFDPQPCPWFIR